MIRIARLSFKGGGAILPIRTPQERQRLVRRIEACTKRYGRMGLALDGQRWTIRMNGVLHKICRSCSHWPSDLAYPGGTSGRFSVISLVAAPCHKVACELAVNAPG